ncbi:MAG: enoyl-CoA hydratase/isomerase family protein [Deltaproteobacteria bacterium]|nr:enoyl-CoA hydratase/isomerase family protein [Candidatus Anaeroferrophillus wilburensis]MBN2888876.1 enoyl-CoA hydratase/isomerase family protein [Deltaproteobacteria bacterium]
MADYQCITYEEKGGAAYLTINRPPLNWLDIATMREMNEALDQVLAAGAELKLLVIQAAGEKAFSVGVDVADHTEDKVGTMIGVFHGIFRRLDRLEIPTLAAVKGAVLGGGCEVALFCDMIVAAENIKIGQPEIKLAVFPPIAAAALPAIIGSKKAYEIVLGGDALRAPEALACGLVNKVVPVEQFDDEVATFVSRFTSLSGSALRSTKRALRAAAGKPFAAALDAVEDLYLNDCMKNHDAHEGLSSFLEQRKPEWQNK